MFDESVTTRFWAKVDKSGPTMPHMQTPCWVWTASKKSNGYGQLILKKGNIISAHRLAYMLENGDIADGLLVCHQCDNPACVRADHLFLGTPKDNAEDCSKKGRRRYVDPEIRKERAAIARKRHYEQNRVDLLDYQKQYREQNRESEKERKRIWYEQNRASVRAHQKEYQQAFARPEPRKKTVVIPSLRLPESLYAEIERICSSDLSIRDVIVNLLEGAVKDVSKCAAE